MKKILLVLSILFTTQSNSNNDIFDCVQQLPDGSFVIKAGDGISCEIYLDNTKVSLYNGELKTNYNEGFVTSTVADLRIKAIQYVLSNLHQITAKNAVFDVDINEKNTYVYALLGEIKVNVCENATGCIQDEISIQQGCEAVIEKNGKISFWKCDNDNNNNNPADEGGNGCSTNTNTAPHLWWVVALLLLLWPMRLRGS